MRRCREEIDREDDGLAWEERAHKTREVIKDSPPCCLLKDRVAKPAAFEPIVVFDKPRWHRPGELGTNPPSRLLWLPTAKRSVADLRPSVPALEYRVSGSSPSWRVRVFDRETPALVGIVTRLKDWELVRSRHWYRIPVRTAPEELDSIQFLAFYQTRLFGREKWAVNWYARVRGISKVTRRELLPDEPGHARAGAEYYKVELGELERLPHPIPSRRWRRIVFIPTSLERLLHAQEINDLFKVSPIEDKLYLTLQEADLPAERQYFVREEGTGYMLDMAVFCRDSNLDIECDGETYHSGRDKADQDRERDNTLTTAGWHILRFSGKRILRDTGHCLETVKRTVHRLGGVSGVEHQD
jgi:very-short-patch-repair endonuclease